jgi:hypothetical protein
LRSEIVRLVRHPASSDGVASISARLGRSADHLSVAFSLEGDLEQLLLPTSVPVRRGDKLWQHTCFEIFLSARMPAYQEFNFSPSGEWAAYRFRGYREAAAASPTDTPMLAVRRSAARLEMDATIPLRDEARLSVAVSAVVESRSGALSYWALKHPAGKPDFHHPDSFALQL